MSSGACNLVNYILEIITKLDINNFIPNFFDRDFLRNKSFGHYSAQSPQTSFFYIFYNFKAFLGCLIKI